jgi:site-specific DNA-methyltransferase (adenine-specific)
MQTSGGQILQGNNLPILKSIPDHSCRLIFIDPPFNSGKVQTRDRIKVKRDENGTRKGFGGEMYTVSKTDSHHFLDSYDDFIGFIKPRIEEAYRILMADGSLFFHIDYREAHYVKVFLDKVFGRESFINEIIWSYDYGGKPKTRWPAKHDTILWYAKNPNNYVFNYDKIDRIKYMAPDLVGPEKAARGKIPTDVWFMTIVPTNSKEKTGYPTQTPSWTSLLGAALPAWPQH